MKSIFQLLLLVQLITTPIYSQFQARPQTPPDFDAKRAVGIHHYDLHKVQRRLKLKEAQIGPVNQLIVTFNTEMDEISLQHAEIFRQRNQDFDKSALIAVSRRDPSQMEGFKARTKEILPPIAHIVQTKEQDLTNELREILDKSQFDKWLKYQLRNRPSTTFN